MSASWRGPSCSLRTPSEDRRRPRMGVPVDALEPGVLLVLDLVELRLELGASGPAACGGYGGLLGLGWIELGDLRALGGFGRHGELLLPRLKSLIPDEATRAGRLLKVGGLLLRWIESCAVREVHWTPTNDVTSGVRVMLTKDHLGALLNDSEAPPSRRPAPPTRASGARPHGARRPRSYSGASGATIPSMMTTACASRRPRSSHHLCANTREPKGSGTRCPFTIATMAAEPSGLV